MRRRIARYLLTSAAAMLAVMSVVFGGMKSASAAQISGAIFTTVADGSEVNYNQYAAKEDVYLNGGPGINAPADAAGLPDGTYVFQVTDPSGKKLLSLDAAGCREFHVSGGVIDAYVTDPGLTCTAHVTGTNSQDGGVTIQLMPFDDTPNNGGVYKVWATPVANYQCDLSLDQADCSAGTHGFLPGYSKTDNFKVKAVPVREIDTRFHDDSTGALIDGLGITWTDTLGATNSKWSYYNVALDVNHEAHVEAPENGTHLITVNNQPDPRDATGQTVCTVIGPIQVTNTYTGDSYSTGVNGPQTVSVKVVPSFKYGTIFVDVTVSCQ